MVTNVRGPEQVPLYVLGRGSRTASLVGFLPRTEALFVAIMSYNGGINFGLLADYDAIDDIDLADLPGIEDAIAELTRSRTPPESPGRARTAPAS